MPRVPGSARSLVCLGWLALLVGCLPQYRTSSGGAYAPAGVTSGTTRSIVLADPGGGLLTRSSLVALGLGAGGAGAIQNPTVKTETNRVGNNVVVTETRSATIDGKVAAAGLAVAQLAADPKTKFFNNSGGFAANLEIASTRLGGDTGGWMFSLGYQFRRTHNTGTLLSGWKGFVGFGLGEYTFYDRTRTRADGFVESGDFVYDYLGVPVRLGYIVGSPKNARAVLPRVGLELFAQGDFNVYGLGDSPTPWHSGAKVNYYVVFVEGVVSASGLGVDDRSYGIVAGLGL